MLLLMKNFCLWVISNETFNEPLSQSVSVSHRVNTFPSLSSADLIDSNRGLVSNPDYLGRFIIRPIVNNSEILCTVSMFQFVI